MSKQVSVVYCRMCGSKCEASAATKVGNGFIGHDCCGYEDDGYEKAVRNFKRQKQLNRVYNRD